MGISQWEYHSFGPALDLVDDVSQKLAKRSLAIEEKLKALRFLAGYSWGREALGKWDSTSSPR